MEYNIEKINEIGKMLAEVVGEAMTQTAEEQVRIGDVEMALRETLKAVGQSGLKQFLENADSELEAEIECTSGGKLQYQRRRAATIWSVFGKVVYKRAYYAGCDCQKGHAPVDNHYGIEAGQVTAGLAHLIALSGIKESFASSQGMTGYVIRARAPLLIPHNVAGWRAEHGIEPVGPRLGAQSWLSAPMITGDRVLGVLTVQSYTTPDAFDEHARDMLAAIANQTTFLIAPARKE